MKCYVCKKKKPKSAFVSKPGNRKVEMCKKCKRIYNKTWYKKNAKRQKANASRNNVRYRAERLAYVQKRKNKPCKDCGRKFPPYVMDFDHVRGKKFKAIAQLVAEAAPMIVIKIEIKKCDVVCANCHRIRTFKRRKKLLL